MSGRGSPWNRESSPWSRGGSRRESILAIVVFPSQNNNNVQRVLVYCSHVKMCKFLGVRRVGLMTHGKCRIDRPFLYHVIRCWVRTSPPPWNYWHWVAYLTPFLRLNPQTRNAVTWTFYRIPGSHSSTSSSSPPLPSATTPVV